MSQNCTRTVNYKCYYVTSYNTNLEQLGASHMNTSSPPQQIVQYIYNDIITQKIHTLDYISMIQTVAYL